MKKSKKWVRALVLLREQSKLRLRQITHAIQWSLYQLQHPLVMMVAVAVLVFVIIYYSKISDTTPSSDAWILAFVSVTSFLVAAFIVFKTKWENWSTLSAGLFGTFLAIGTLYGLTVYVYYQEPLPFMREAVTAIRDLLVVGSLFVAVGLVQETWYEHNYSWARLKQWLKTRPTSAKQRLINLNRRRK